MRTWPKDEHYQSFLLLIVFRAMSIRPYQYFMTCTHNYFVCEKQSISPSTWTGHFKIPVRPTPKPCYLCLCLMVVGWKKKLRSKGNLHINQLNWLLNEFGLNITNDSRIPLTQPAFRNMWEMFPLGGIVFSKSFHI